MSVCIARCAAHQFAQVFAYHARRGLIRYLEDLFSSLSTIDKTPTDQRSPISPSGTPESAIKSKLYIIFHAPKSLQNWPEKGASVDEKK